MTDIPKTREEFNAREKALKDKNSALATAESRGVEKGIAIGEERGIAIGEERGKAEGEASVTLTLASLS